MPTRKISERERLTIFARTASDDELAQALEILTVESRVRGRAGKQPADKADKKPRASKKPTKGEVEAPLAAGGAGSSEWDG